MLFAAILFICALSSKKILIYILFSLDWLLSIMEGFPLEDGGSSGGVGPSQPRLPDLNGPAQPRLPDLNGPASPESEQPLSPEEETQRQELQQRIRQLFAQYESELKKNHEVLEKVSRLLWNRKQLYNAYKFCRNFSQYLEDRRRGR